MVGFVPLLLEEFRTQGAREAARRFAHVVYVLLPGLVFGYLLMGLIWPWSIMEPGNPFQALTYFSHFFEKPWKEMFDGALVSVPDMPWSYLPTLFALQLPEVLLALLLAAVVGTFMSLSRNDVPARRKTILLMLTLAATLPLVIAMVKRPGALQRHPAFHLRHPADGGAGRRRLRVGHELAQGKPPQLAARRAGRVHLRPAAAARRNDPAASLPIHPLQPHRRHGPRPPTICSCWTIGASR